MSAIDDALEKLDALAASNGGQGVLLVLMPEYRPDIVKAFSHWLGLRLFDYRAEVMAARGAEAHTIPLDSLSERLAEEAAAGGLLAHNVEALLATKSGEDRRAWLGEMVETALPRPLLMVLTLFPDDAPAESGRVLDLRDTEFGDQGLVSRLLH